MSDLIDRYLREVLPRKASRRAPSGQLQWWREKIGHLPATALTPERLVQMKTALMRTRTTAGKKRSDSTVNRYLTTLSHVFTVAIKEWFWVHENPVSKIQKLREPPGRVRFLSDEERQRLLEAVRQGPPSLEVVVVLALYTGMRYGEIMGLRWQNIDFARKRLVLEKTKNGSKRGIPLTEPSLEVLIRWAALHSSAQKDSLLFPSESGDKPFSVRTSWRTAVKKASIEDFHFHDLRHCTASYMAMTGATPQEIAEVLGHKTLQMVSRYAHLAESHVRGVLEKMATRYTDP